MAEVAQKCFCLSLMVLMGCLRPVECFTPAVVAPLRSSPHANGSGPRFSSLPLIPAARQGRGNVAASAKSSGGGGGEENFWWEERGGLPFECTGCGKCCKVQGDVWVNPSDVNRMADVKQMSVPDFTEEYAEREVGGWVQLKNRKRGEGEELDHGCVFLGQDNKTCGIYDARPLQCSVYPFFPRLISTPEAWNGEVVSPEDDENPRYRKWTSETGGCEGMSEVKGIRFNQKKGKWVFKDGKTSQENEAIPNVPASEIRQQLEEYEDYFLDFPHEFLLLNKSKKRRGKAAGTEKEGSLAAGDGMPEIANFADFDAEGRPELFYDQLFALSNMMKKEIAMQEGSSGASGGDGTEATAAGGVEDAEDGAAFERGGLEYEPGDVVGSDGKQLVTAAEMSMTKTLMAWAEKHVIRLGLCPFAPPAMETGKVRFRICTGVTKEDEALEIFLEEANMIMETPEKELPTTLIAFPDLYSGDFLSWNDFALNIEDLLDEEGGWAEVGDEVLIAAFHPDFEFGGLSSDEEVLNYEKRAPIPVINLLRTAAIDRGIERGVTAERIASDNEESLLAEGIEGVVTVYEGLGKDAARE